MKSKCCNANISVSTGGEGTSCYICGLCGEACDLVPPTNTEVEEIILSLGISKSDDGRWYMNEWVDDVTSEVATAIRAITHLIRQAEVRGRITELDNWLEVMNNDRSLFLIFRAMMDTRVSLQSQLQQLQEEGNANS